MKKTLRGFTFIEVIMYIGLFSLLGTALFTFTWDVMGLVEQGKTDRLLVEEARFATERIKYFIRNASGIDQENSVWDSGDGRLVLDLLGSSDTLTLERQNEQLVMQISGQDPIVLQSQSSRTSALIFERYHAADLSVEYVDVTVTMETLLTAPIEYSSAITLKTGVVLRSLGL